MALTTYNFAMRSVAPNEPNTQAPKIDMTAAIREARGSPGWALWR